jgi:hypothetical protein
VRADEARELVDAHAQQFEVEVRQVDVGAAGRQQRARAQRLLVDVVPRRERDDRAAERREPRRGVVAEDGRVGLARPRREQVVDEP